MMGRPKNPHAENLARHRRQAEEFAAERTQYLRSLASPPRPKPVSPEPRETVEDPHRFDADD